MRRLTFLIVVALVAGACGDAATAADPERFCEIDAEFEDSLDVFNEGVTRDAADEMRDILDKAVKVAPDEIRSSVEIVSDGMMRLLDIFEAADFDEAQIDQAELDFFFTDEAIPTASDAMDDWSDANCSTSSEDDGDSAGPREFGKGSEWIDEPLPSLEQLEGATTCDELMRMLVGVENERFRLKVDVTAADDAANNYTHWDFNELDVFAERQGDAGCSDLEGFTILDNAHLARCDRWFLDGHGVNEDPLMLNTAQC